MTILPKNFSYKGLRAGLLPLLAALLCAGCVSPAEQALRTREKKIRTTLATLKPDSTRAELNRLLPPSTPATPHDTNLISMDLERWEPSDMPEIPLFSGESAANSAAKKSSVKKPTAPRFTAPDDVGIEIHPLDRDFSLVVKYQYRNYRQIRSLPKTKAPETRNGAVAIRLNLDPDKYDRVWPNPKDRIVRALVGRNDVVNNLNAPGRPVWPAFAYWVLSEGSESEKNR